MRSALFLPWIIQLTLAHQSSSFQTLCGTFRTAWWVLPVGVVAKLLFCHPFLSPLVFSRPCCLYTRSLCSSHPPILLC
ncbi:hypothetical protein CBS63078_5569 [Aspergillus niger]|nr:hypothetical protein CBS115989_625 [Aspergillus niger]KAI2825309.1 hypothetical protein CBS133816_8626 [Aspergillus niger]KAI2839467.1 hypothetical protein CBS11350_7533 [Aspergillus niger]KAI2852985.1 hypothetical protein CBS12448_8151 [Aspergillus niger]KAI2859310.1 hypothetical protein CBS11232_2197 [Aspergillus niger]